MAITIQQTPQDFQPCYYKQNWAATSTEWAQPQFTYRIIVTDVLTGINRPYQFPASPTGPLTFDSSTFSELRMRNYIPINIYGFQICVNAIRQIRVNIGEQYGAGTPVYYAGVNIEFIVWNAALDFLQMFNYNQNEFVSDPTDPISPILVWLTDTLPECVFTDRSNLFYKLKTGTSSSTFQIYTYDSNGGSLGVSDIYEPSGVTYDQKYLAIDLGLKGLTNTIANFGTNPIITPAVAYYDLYDTVITGFTIGGDPIYGNSTFVKRYTVCCEEKNEVITLHALMRNGNFRTVHCSKVSELSATISKQVFKKLPYQIATLGQVSYPYESAVEQVLNVEIQDNIKVQTDWITEAESLLFKDVAASQSIFMDLGSGKGYASVRCIDGTYNSRKRYPDGLFNVSFQIQYTHTNNRQRA